MGGIVWGGWGETVLKQLKWGETPSCDIDHVTMLIQDYRNYFRPVIYTWTRILPRINFRRRVTIMGIAYFERGFEKEAL